MGDEIHGNPKERVTTTRSKRAQCSLGAENQSVKHESRMQRSREVARASMQPCGRSKSAAPAPICPQRRDAARAVCAPAACSPVALLWFAGAAGGSGIRSWLQPQDGPQLHWVRALPEDTGEQQHGRTLSRRRQQALLLACTLSPCFCEALAGPHPQARPGGVGNASAKAARHAAILDIRCGSCLAITVRLHWIRVARFRPCLAYYRQYLPEKLGHPSLLSSWRNGRWQGIMHRTAKRGKLKIRAGKNGCQVIILRGSQYLRP